jgi:hypothetical protein
MLLEGDRDAYVASRCPSLRVLLKLNSAAAKVIMNPRLLSLRWVVSTTESAQDDAEYARRRRAREMAAARYGFRWHLPTYVLVNAFLVILWAYSGGGFFWPIFPLVFWGLGVLTHYWGAYRSMGTSWIDRETERILREEKEGRGSQ